MRISAQVRDAQPPPLDAAQPDAQLPAPVLDGQGAAQRSKDGPARRGPGSAEPSRTHRYLPEHGRRS
jgi:hypothetical protein